MPQLHTCPHGHQWEASAETGPGSEGDPSACPVCREGTSTGSAETVESVPSAEATLPAPRRPAAVPQPADGPGQTLAMPSKSAAPSAPTADAAAADHTLPSPARQIAGAAAPSMAFAETLAPDGTGRSPALAGSESTLPAPAQPGREPPPAVPSDGTLSSGSAGDAGAESAGSFSDGTKVLTPTLAAQAAAASAPSEVIDPADDGTRVQTRFGAARPAAPSLANDRTRPTGSAPAAPVGPAIPGYKILGELGRGGMGVVYKARQIGLNRIVALKMILAGEFAGQDELARFRLEAEAVAKLQHPNIVQVYEIDEMEGKPYFCLEFVDGGPLDKRLAGAPQPVRQAAELIEKLARAMACAHERHIIHRDLKPANILMTSAGEPKITDFGLAKRLDSQDMHTQSGSVMGTPSYMAPEQAHGRIKEIGPASDVYSLGAILYETLVGRPPFKGETVVDTLDQVRTLEPTAPSRLRPKLPHDLETICLKCLQKEPAKRYGEAAALADDLRRYLAGEPIKARPTPWWERSWKWARRRPAWAALAATAAVLVLVLIGAGFAFGGMEQAQLRTEDRHNQELTRKNREIADQLGQARGNFHLAEDTFRRMISRVFAERLRYEPKMEQLRQRVLGDALDFNELLLKTYAGDPEARREIARAHAMEGDVFYLRGDPKSAEQHFDSARTILKTLRDDYPNDPQYRRDLAQCMNDLGTLLQEAHRTPEAEAAFREALDLLAPVVDGGTQDEDQRQLATMAANLGNLLKDEGRLTEAESLLRQSVELNERLAASSDPENGVTLAHSREVLGSLLGAAGRLDEAESVCRTANVALEKLTAEAPDAPDYTYDLAESYEVLGALGRDVQPKQAEEQYQKALAASQKLVSRYPSVPSYERMLAEVHRNLAVLRQAAGRTNDAQQDYDQALEIETRVADLYPSVPDFQLDLGRTLNNAGVRWQTGNQLPKAEDSYDKARGIFEKLTAGQADGTPYQQELAATLQNLGVLYVMTNRADDGGKLLAQAADLRRKLAEAHPDAPELRKDLARAEHNLAGFWQATGNAPNAEACYRDAADQLDKLAAQYPQVPDYRHMLAYALKDYGILLRAMKRGPEAEKLWARAVDLLTALTQEESTVPAYRQELARTLSEWGIYQASSGNASEGEKTLVRTLEIQEKLAGDFPKDPMYRQELAVYYDNLGLLYARGGRLNQAEQNYRRAVDLAEELEKADPTNPVYWSVLVQPYMNLVNLATAQNPLANDLPDLWQRRADNARKLAAAYPKAPVLQSQAGLTLEDMAAWLRERRRLPEARDALKQAVAFQRTAVDLAAAPVKNGYRALLCDESLALAETLLALNDRGGVAEAVAELTKAKPAGWPGKPEIADRLQAVQDALRMMNDE